MRAHLPHIALFALLTSPAAAWAEMIPLITCTIDATRQSNQVGTVQSDKLDEVSGLAWSRTQNALWVHNDSGDAARLYAISPTGVFIGQWSVNGASAVDWEDLALGACDVSDRAKGDCLFIADIGNNSESRTDQTIYRVREPQTPGAPDGQTRDTETADAYPVVYELPEGDPNPSPDAESFAVHPLTGKLYIVTKENNRGRVLESDPPGAPGASLIFRPIGEVPLHKPTAADISPDGKGFAVRGYFEGREYSSADGDIAAALARAPQTLRLELEAQGEALAYGAAEELEQPPYIDGSGYHDTYIHEDVVRYRLLTTSEKVEQPIWSYDHACKYNDPVYPPEPMDMAQLMDMPEEADLSGEADMGAADMSGAPDMSDTSSDEAEDGCAAAGAAAPAALVWLLIPAFSWRRKRRDTSR